MTGLEPATNFPNFKTFERQRGRVRSVPPGGRWSATWCVEIYDSAEAVAKVLAEIVALQAHARPVIHKTPQPQFSPL